MSKPLEGILCVPLTTSAGGGHLDQQWKEAIVVTSKDDPNLKSLIDKYQGQWYDGGMMYKNVKIYLPLSGGKGKSRRNIKHRKNLTYKIK